MSKCSSPLSSGGTLLNGTADNSGDNMLPATRSPAVPSVGLCESTYSAKQRQLLDLMNKLHNTGIQSEIDLPQICVIGSQSAGKSSLIESISGITLPRSAGTCTRCPTECRLSYSNKPWQCRVYLRYIKDSLGADIHPVRNVPFGTTMYNRPDVEDRVRRAQLAILNPQDNPDAFLHGDLGHISALGNKLAFSKNYISVEISGPEVTNLSFWMIANVREGHDERDIRLVKDMIASYIKKPSCIILLTVTCETDFENQGARKLAKKYDPSGKRTIGVLTKPDRIESGEEEKWLSFVRGDTETLQKGWFCVKQPSPAELAENLTWEDARRREEAFFQSKEPWKLQVLSVQQKFGTARLTNRLSDILSDLILTRLPSIQSEIYGRLQGTITELDGLPQEVSDDPVGALVAILVNFGREVTRSVDGIPGAGGLVQQLRQEYVKFRQAIRETAPTFHPYKRSKNAGTEDEPELPAIQFLPEGEVTSAKGIVYYDDDIARISNEAITRELPRNVPFVVKRKLIGETIDLWHTPVEVLVDNIKKVLISHMRILVDTYFGQHEHGGLHNTVWGIVSERITQLLEQAATTIRFLYQLEKDQTFTLNDHYLSDYKEKFKTYYSAAKRQNRSGAESSFLSGLAKGMDDKQYISRHTMERTPFAENLCIVVSKLAEMGVSISPLDLAKVVETDNDIESLDVMAEVRAYYQVCYKRFTDVVCMTADQALVRAFANDLDMYLCKTLGTSNDGAKERCSALLANSNEVKLTREALNTRRDRLEAAKKEILLLWNV